jgi:hypothetical protein
MVLSPGGNILPFVLAVRVVADHVDHDGGVGLQDVLGFDQLQELRVAGRYMGCVVLCEVAVEVVEPIRLQRPHLVFQGFSVQHFDDFSLENFHSGGLYFLMEQHHRFLYLSQVPFVFALNIRNRNRRLVQRLSRSPFALQHRVDLFNVFDGLTVNEEGVLVLFLLQHPVEGNPVVVAGLHVVKILQDDVLLIRNVVQLRTEGLQMLALA